MCMKLCVFERELKQGLKCLEEQVLTLQAEREIWLQYKNVGRHKDKEEIDYLQDELSGLQKGFEEMAGDHSWYSIPVLRRKRNGSRTLKSIHSV